MIDKINIIILKVILENVIYYGDYVGLTFRTVSKIDADNYLEKISKKVEELKIPINSLEFKVLLEHCGNITSFSDINLIWKGATLKIAFELTNAVMSDNLTPLAILVSGHIFINNKSNLEEFLYENYCINKEDLVLLIKRKIVNPNKEDDSKIIKKLYREKLEKY